MAAPKSGKPEPKKSPASTARLKNNNKAVASGNTPAGTARLKNNNKAVASGNTPASTALVESLASIMNEAGLTELEYCTEKVEIRLSRQTQQAAPSVQHAVMAPPAEYSRQSTETAAEKPAASNSQQTDTAAAEATEGAVTSPMVGTCYLAAEPGADPFIREGDSVKAGQTLVIVEAMKVMNPITAPTAGTVKRIIAENGQPVEYGQALVIIV